MNDDRIIPDNVDAFLSAALRLADEHQLSPVEFATALCSMLSIAMLNADRRSRRGLSQVIRRSVDNTISLVEGERLQ